MASRDEVVNIIYSVVDEVNDLQPDGMTLDKEENTILMGESGKLDSMGLVTFVIKTELAIEDTLGRSVSLTDERAMSQRNSPFRTIDTLASYIEVLLGENSDG